MYAHHIKPWHDSRDWWPLCHHTPAAQAVLKAVTSCLCACVSRTSATSACHQVTVLSCHPLICSLPPLQTSPPLSALCQGPFGEEPCVSECLLCQICSCAAAGCLQSTAPFSPYAILPDSNMSLASHLSGPVLLCLLRRCGMLTTALGGLSPHTPSTALPASNPLSAGCLSQPHMRPTRSHTCAEPPPPPRAEAISHESAHDTRSTHSGVPGECLAEDSGGHVATGHFNTISSSLRHTSSAEIAAAGAPPHRRAASANLRTPPATHDMRALPRASLPRPCPRTHVISERGCAYGCYARRPHTYMGVPLSEPQPTLRPVCLAPALPCCVLDSQSCVPVMPSRVAASAPATTPQHCIACSPCIAQTCIPAAGPF